MKKHLSKIKTELSFVGSLLIIGTVILTGEYLFLSQLAKFGW